MRRADRLFQIIQILRRSTRPVTAAMLSAELEVSVRTVYRDMADLMAQRVPISGEAGLGYLIDADYDMPPLMLTLDEVEVAVLGAEWVASHFGQDMAAAARDLIAKIAAVIPAELRPYIAEPSVGVRPALALRHETIDSRELRAAIRTGMKVRLRYRAASGEETLRTVWPVILGYTEGYRMLIGWCEMRQDFRHFRTDRIIVAEVLDEPHGLRKGELRRKWDSWRAARLAASGTG